MPFGRLSNVYLFHVLQRSITLCGASLGSSLQGHRYAMRSSPLLVLPRRCRAQIFDESLLPNMVGRAHLCMFFQELTYTVHRLHSTNFWDLNTKGWKPVIERAWLPLLQSKRSKPLGVMTAAESSVESVGAFSIRYIGGDLAPAVKKTYMPRTFDSKVSMVRSQ